MLLAGYKLLVPRGYEFSVNFLGKAATWLLYAALALRHGHARRRTQWPLWIFWTGLALALAAGALYIVLALWRAVRR